jgi:hypothetical protein
MQFKTRPTFAP